MVNNSKLIEISIDVCPLGGDINNNCADCVYNVEYEFNNGECIKKDGVK